jgi:hypothetical protein
VLFQIIRRTVIHRKRGDKPGAVFPIPLTCRAV